MDEGDLLVQHLRPGLRQPVDRVVDAQLVAGNRLGRDDDRVAPLDAHVLVVAVSDPRERRHGLALAASAEHEHPVRRQLHRLPGRHERVLRQVDVPQVARDVHVLAERAPDERDLAAVRDPDFGGLLHPVDVRGERRDEDPALAGGTDLAEGFADESLRTRHPRSLRVGRVSEQEVDAESAELGELTDVRLQPVDRGVVELPVAGVQHATGGRVDHDRHARPGSSAPYGRTEAERPDLDAFALRLGLAQGRRGARPCSSSFDLIIPKRQAGRDHLPDLDLAQHVRQRPHVVLVPVGEHDRSQRAVLEVREVG